MVFTKKKELKGHVDKAYQTQIWPVEKIEYFACRQEDTFFLDTRWFCPC